MKSIRGIFKRHIEFSPLLLIRGPFLASLLLLLDTSVYVYIPKYSLLSVYNVICMHTFAGLFCIGQPFHILFPGEDTK